ncbi:MAG: YihY/virulence factor BrkB family protein [Chloroflexales bacterium]|nr:YihY/virulence factor BrkB family protein [Chloroflexales bacterium]
MGDTLKTKVLPFLQRTFQEWQKDRCLDMGTSLAYYTLFSLFPLLLIMLSIVGFVVREGTDARKQIMIFVNGALASQIQLIDVITGALDNLSANSPGAISIGSLILLMSASGVFLALDRSFDIIWDFDPAAQPQKGIAGQALTIIQQRLFAFALVVGCAFLVLVSMLSNVVIGIVIEVVGQYTGGIVEQEFLLRTAQFFASLLILTLVLMLLFKYLPHVRVAWGDVWLGALITAILFVVLQRLISGVGIQIGSNFQSYGAIGGVMALMLWIYLTSLILFLGGELTYVYAHMFGSYSKPPAPEQEEAAAPGEATELVQVVPDAVKAATTAPRPAANAAPLPHARQAARTDRPASQNTIVAAGVGAIVGMLGACTIGLGALIIGVRRAVQRLRGTPGR